MILLIAILIPLIIYIYVKKRQRYQDIWQYVDVIPGPKSYPVLGTTYELHTQASLFTRDRIRAKEFFPIYKEWSLGVPVVNIIHPDDIELVTTNPKSITKSFIYHFLHPWLGNGILTSTGSPWHKRRKILTPAFHMDILHQFVEVFNKETTFLVERLKKVCNAPYLNLSEHITDYTLFSVAETSLGISLREDKSCASYKKALYDFGADFAYWLIRPWLYVPIIYKYSSLCEKNTKSIEVMHNFSKNVITERKKTFELEDTPTYSKTKYRALLDVLLTTQHNGNPITVDEIREELDTFIFEGHDTTSVSIMYTLMALANEPKIQEEIYDEIISVIGDSETPTLKELGELKLMERCIKESLRLYPSVGLIGREVGENLQTKTGYTIPKDCNVHIFIFDLHRRPEFWEDPLKFDPDRFLPENCTGRHPFAYIPFSAGHRNCIGQKFAMLEMKSVYCGILRNFKLEPITKPEDIVFKTDLVLRTENEIRVKFVPRK
ncbi:cytochrome P450 4C1-like isoform X1 [Diabrotica virgifera virgifera]|uniref:Cytochrome P450 4C1-like n=2 Tax=Diabrotica virgifera virgifera TaxID=50390 RepID=A0ABM5JVT9_DIAVI|nr:cytochrome P450 4C1-like isoform X1 [Diabrotica virgifera virgifera]